MLSLTPPLDLFNSLMFVHLKGQHFKDLKTLKGLVPKGEAMGSELQPVSGKIPLVAFRVDNVVV